MFVVVVVAWVHAQSVCLVDNKKKKKQSKKKIEMRWGEFYSSNTLRWPSSTIICVVMFVCEDIRFLCIFVCVCVYFLSFKCVQTLYAG